VSEGLEMRSLLNSASASILVDTPHQGVRLEFSSPEFLHYFNHIGGNVQGPGDVLSCL
jgi:hypothetical protein